MSDRMNNDAGSSRSSSRSSSQNRDRATGSQSSEFQRAVERLEKAVHELVNTARDQFSDRATAFIDETTDRLEREFGGRARSSTDSEAARARMRERRQNRRSARRSTQRTGRLYRDPEHQKIAGVCAGIANYYGVESWVVRCIAVTGMLFLPSIVFPAYWIMYFVMDKPPRNGLDNIADNGRDRSRGSHVPPAEFGSEPSPRVSLRNAQAGLAQVELRLRRMESHVTSGQYELQRELNKIDEKNHAG